MRNLWRNTIFVLVIVLLAIWAIIPPSEKLRRGKDLAGGASLVYQVELKPTDPADTIPRMIELLKRRVDPDGVLDITMVRQGANRIEITMPAPSERVKELRASYDRALDQLAEGSLTNEQFGRLVRLAVAEREAEIKRIAGEDAERGTLLRAAAETHDKAIEARTKFNADRAQLQTAIDTANSALTNATAASAPPEELSRLREEVNKAKAAMDDAAKRVAELDAAFADAKAKALATSIPVADVRRALELSDKDRIIKGAQPTDPDTVIKSPRKRALERLRASHPAAAPRLDAVIEKFATYQKLRSTLDDPTDLQRMLKGAGVLEFRIAVQPGELAKDEARLRAELRAGGPKSVKFTDARWFKVNKLDGWYDTEQQFKALTDNPAFFFQSRGLVGEEFDGEVYVLLYDVPGSRLTQAEGGWKVAGSRPGSDEMGRPCINFTMDELGADRMGVLTANNRQKAMAVLLDDQVYTAPTIQSRIGKSGQITGSSYTTDEINYIVRTLAAGSLAAKLSPEPISVNTIGPELGADNLQRGLYSGAISFVLISGFMIVYYFTGGWISTFALMLNALFILALMAMNRAAFSLPGIAGIILTFGMAVDANVLIYERLREELLRGHDLRTAVRLAYSHALSAIVDGHVTILIVCVVLGFTGTPEIRGFAITMSIGVITTLFCQLFVTRIIYSFLVEKLHWKRMSMLPLAIPALNRLLHPSFHWMKHRTAFIAFSVVVTGLCILAVAMRGKDLLDNEFSGGTKVTIQLKNDESGKPIAMTRAAVEKQLEDKIHELSRDPANSNLRVFVPKVVIVNPVEDKSSRFTVKTTLTDTKLVTDTVSAAFANQLDIQEPLVFEGSTVPDWRQAPVKPITVSRLGDNIDRPDIDNDVSEYLGGAAVLLNKIESGHALPSLASLENRLRQMLGDARFTDTLARQRKFIVLDGDERAVKSAALLVKDPSIDFLQDQQRWSAELKPSEWTLVTEAMSRSSTLAGVESFSPSIAATFAAQAIVAVLLSGVLIVIYVWVRFASFRYSMAAILATLHDCVVALGFIAGAGYLVRFAPGVAETLGILDFKLDLNVIAALLTILGYSLNDTIVIMDRIRENRGKLHHATAAIIDRSINETLSRTFITSGTVLVATIVLYLVGGEAVRAFAFCFLVGVVTGTYSSVAIAAPIVWSRKLDSTHPDFQGAAAVSAA